MSSTTPSSLWSGFTKTSSRKAKWAITGLLIFIFTSCPNLLVDLPSYYDADDGRQLGANENGNHYLAGTGSGPVNLDVKRQCSESFNTGVFSMWNNFHDTILNATIPSEYSSNTNFTDWINTLFDSEYQAHQLISSATHPPNSDAIFRLLQIIHDRLDFLEKGGSPDSITPSPPLHILVLGESVTAGVGCMENHVGIRVPGWWATPHSTCAWPYRLEKLFNQVLFQGKSVVKVTNLATGGSSSEIGKVLLEYQLFDDETKKLPPHVVISAHAPNDAKEADMDLVEHTHMPGLIHAARKLRLCDDELPMVVMLDDWYGQETFHHTKQSKISAMQYKMSSFYGLMGVSHSNVIKHKIYVHHDNSTILEPILGHGVLDNIHPAMGSHIGVAWTVFFNFLKGFTENCEYGEMLGYGARKTDDHGIFPTMSISADEKEEDIKSLAVRWKKDAEWRKDYCSKQEANSSSEVCTYAWMVNQMTGILRPPDVWKRLKDNVVSCDSWEVSGFPIKQPRTGWYTKKEHAKFSLKLVATLETNFLTIMSMKSWKTSKETELKVSVQIIGSNHTSSKKDYSISGYHEMQTSIHVPHKLELPEGGASEGDTILVDAELFGGDSFKINGLAFCTY